MKQGDVTTQAAADILQHAEIRTSSRNLLTATSAVNFTGVAFKPTAVIGLSAEAAVSDIFSIGFATRTGTTNRGISYDETVNIATEDEFFGWRQTAGEVLVKVTAWLDDGITLTFTRTSAPTGTASFRLLFFQ